MRKPTLLLVFGTRPEAVKMAPLALAAPGSGFRVRILVTAQHRGMLDQVLRLFGIRPDHDLDIMREGQSLTEVSVRALTRLEPVLARRRPDMVLVHGDTATTLIAGLAAFYQRIPVGHVEAGLRTGDPGNPFPEEMNRRLTDALAAVHFAPTAEAKRNLVRENADPERIFVTGNTGIDALKMGLARLEERPARLPSNLARAVERPFLLVTAHRRESFGPPLRNVFLALRDIARSRRDLGIVYPVHPNPQVRGPAKAVLGREPNVLLTEPLDYGPFLTLLRRCLFVVTDSGGLQEEAPSLGKPVLALRRVTERPEAVRAGTVRVIGTDRAVVRRWMERLLDDGRTFDRMARAVNPYGDGRAAERTLKALRHFFDPRRPRPADFKPS